MRIAHEIEALPAKRALSQDSHSSRNERRPDATATIMKAVKLAASMVLLWLSGAGSALAFDASESVDLYAGWSATVVMDDVRGVRVEDESIARASLVDARNLMLRAQAPGQTKVHVRQRGGKELTMLVRVSGLEQAQLREDLPAAALELKSAISAGDATELYVGAVTTLRVGKVKRLVVGNDSVVQASVLDSGDVLVLGKAPGVSALSVWTEDRGRQQLTFRIYKAPPGDSEDLLRAVLSESFPDVAIRQHKGTNILTGTVDAVGFEAFENLVEKLGVISLVKPQINVVIEKSIALDVRVLEVNRNYQKTVGVRWADTSAGPAIGVVGNLVPNNRFGVFSDVGETEDLREMLNAVGTGTQRLSSYFGITSIISSELQMLQEEGLARVLAAPSLSTVNGEKATFLAGGDLPVAVLNQFGQPVVEFRQYGIQLEILPVADRFQNIRSKVKAEVSSVDFSTQVNGVPGLLRRATESTITARPGETIIISGLLDSRESRNVDKLPGLGEIPIIGALFRSKDFQQQRTELVIAVTPRLQSPNEPMTPELQRAEAGLRKSLSGSEKLDRSLAK